jgi:hypothetical protein
MRLALSEEFAPVTREFRVERAARSVHEQRDLRVAFGAR